MDWLQGIQKAIDYIEENITEKIDYEEVAKRAYSSSFHFQRVFGIMCGFTLGEYIRRRRLTLAANELLSKNRKVIDVAFKYGYEIACNRFCTILFLSKQGWIEVFYLVCL